VKSTQGRKKNTSPRVKQVIVLTRRDIAAMTTFERLHEESPVLNDHNQAYGKKGVPKDIKIDE